MVEKEPQNYHDYSDHRPDLTTSYVRWLQDLGPEDAGPLGLDAGHVDVGGAARRVCRDGQHGMGGATQIAAASEIRQALGMGMAAASAA